MYLDLVVRALVHDMNFLSCVAHTSPYVSRFQSQLGKKNSDLNPSSPDMYQVVPG
jgi:hypothetical protein